MTDAPITSTTPTPATTQAPNNQTVSAGKTDTSSKQTAAKAETVTPDAGTKPVEVKPDAQTGERKFKVKVDGKEIEVTEQELISGYSLNKTSTQRMQEAAAVKKQAETFIKMLRENPMKVLQNPNLGVDARKFAEEYLIQAYQDEIDPKSAENRRLKEQLAEIEAQRKAIEAEEAQRKIDEETQYWMQEYVKDIDGAIASSKTLPQNNKAVYERVLHYIMLGTSPDYVQRNGRAATAKDVLPLVENEFKEMTKSLYKDATPEQLMEFFGEDISKKIRKYDVERIKNPVVTTKPKYKNVVKNEKPKGLMDFKELLKQKDIEKGFRK